ncbi:MAG: hypothetical protein Q4A84_03805 [Neisseria sp.]|uniref:hypothetical protein n=1 Tax=Neisseria sp. TaxID=192066 RepID=UPI0026DB0E3D|nr:hypothetical protein [Neisseria sp.]MDO4640814.1 hypothetical protein [Neisseria sp.]
MRKLFALFTKTNPKEIVLHCKEDIQKHAGALSTLSMEDRENLADYLTQVEINQRLPSTEKNPTYGYGVSVGRAIEIQKHRSN